MENTFKKHETLYCILLIVIYIISNSFCLEQFGLTDFRMVIVNTILSLLLVLLILLLKRREYYGLVKVKNYKDYLYFIPLVLIVSVNLWTGININNTTTEIICHILNMINIGFIEEIIFRGFLFKMMEKDNVKSAIIVSSITFGIGHIVNLLNGSDLIPTLMQISYAIAVGYLFVIIFYKSKSLLPCIVAHSLTNALSIFNVDNNITMYLVPLFLVVTSITYAIYINKKVKE